MSKMFVMRISILLLFSILSHYISPKVDVYIQAKNLVVESKEYAELNINRENYQVSEQLVSFLSFSKFFKSTENLAVDFDTQNEIAFINKNLLYLNQKKYGKVKIFFSEQKNNVFFAEILLDKKKKMLYSDRPAFGSSLLYMFTVSDNKVVLKEVKRMHYN